MPTHFVSLPGTARRRAGKAGAWVRASQETGRIMGIACGIWALGLVSHARAENTNGLANPEVIELAYLGPYFGDRQPAATVPPLTNALAAREWFGVGQPFLEWSRLTGDWAGLRPQLESNGVALACTYLADSSMVLSGGLEHRYAFRGLFNLNLTFDPQPLLGIEGGRLFAQYYVHHGPNGSEDTGALQNYSNLDASRFRHVEELWYEQKLFHERLRLKVGQVDANSEFDFVAPATAFINSSAGFSPTITAFPTYPEPSLSANLFVYPASWCYAGAGVYTESLGSISARSFDRPFVVGETGITFNHPGRLGPGRIAGGLWHTLGPDVDAAGADRGTTGFFALAEQQVWKMRPGEASDNRGVSVFAQYGYADPNVSLFQHHFGVGFSALGVFSARPADSFGMYLSWARLGPATAPSSGRAEGDLESYYSFQVTPFLALKPDLQAIFHPGGDPAIGVAWVATLRAIISF